jgi:hypothetical protein
MQRTPAERAHDEACPFPHGFRQAGRNGSRASMECPAPCKKGFGVYSSACADFVAFRPIGRTMGENPFKKESADIDLADVEPSSSAQDIARQLRSVEATTDALHVRLSGFQPWIYTSGFAIACTVFLVGFAVGSVFSSLAPDAEFTLTLPLSLAFLSLLYAAVTLTVTLRRLRLLRSRDSFLRHYHDILFSLLLERVS